jgi:hypothetical protein
MMTSDETHDEAEVLLRHASGVSLLRTFAALTHRLHVADRERTAAAPIIRSQRDRVELEILKRMDVGRLPERDRSRGNPDGEMVRDQPPSGPQREVSHE